MPEDREMIQKSLIRPAALIYDELVPTERS